MITHESTGEEVLAALLWFFGDQEGAIPFNLGFLQKASCEWHAKPVPTFCDSFDYTLKLFVPPDDVSAARMSWVEIDLYKAFSALIHDDSLHNLFRKVYASPPEQQRTTGLNNCFFNQEKTILHDGLRFRSRGEIAIYDELKQRSVLFFPNPAAVMGTVGTEFGAKVAKKEPDFLICYKGKWGILEINGDDFHSGVVQTAKDHDRARQFQHYGVFFIQAFALNRCKNDPCAVVDEFLKLLWNHK